MALSLSTEARRAMELAAQASFPNECCGLLLGRALPGGREVVATHMAANVAGTPRRTFTLDPAALLAGAQLAATRGLAVIGCFHSHGARPAVPSAADELGAQPGWSHAILAWAPGRASELRSFVLTGSALVEEPVTVR